MSSSESASPQEGGTCPRRATNWKGFCENLADAGDALNFHPAVPVPSKSVGRRPLPFLPDLFGICQNRYRQIWCSSWELVGDETNPPVPSVASRGSRSGTLR